jgi:hypothetical protein
MCVCALVFLASIFFAETIVALGFLAATGIFMFLIPKSQESNEIEEEIREIEEFWREKWRQKISRRQGLLS